MVETIHHATPVDDSVCSYDFADDTSPPSPMSGPLVCLAFDPPDINIYAFSTPSSTHSPTRTRASTHSPTRAPPFMITQTISLTNTYVSSNELRIPSRRQSTEECTLNDDIESIDSACESCVYSSTYSSKVTSRTLDTCVTNPKDFTIHELTPTQMVPISASRLRYLEYVEKNISTIVQSAVDDHVK